MMGIYQITNTANGKVYVGSSVRLRRRLSEHQNKLARGSHENDRLQKAFNKYGADAFVFAIIETVADRRLLLSREQVWIDAKRAADRTLGFNIYPLAGSPSGASHSPEARQKMRDAAKTRPPASAETRAKISRALSGRKKTPEHIERHRQAVTGKFPSAETRAKLSAAQKGKRRAAESIEKMAAHHRGMKRSPEARAKMSAAAKARCLREAAA